MVALVACVVAGKQDQESAELYFRTYGYVRTIIQLIFFFNFVINKLKIILNIYLLMKQYPSWYSGYAYSGYPYAYNYGYAGKYYGYY